MLKKKSLLLVVFVLSVLSSIEAQVQIIQQPANPYQFSCEEVWNLNLVSPYTKSFHAKGKALIKSSDGRTIAELRSEEFLVNPGANLLSSMTLSTIKKTYFNKDIQEIEEITGSLPAGSYKLCIQFSCSKPNCDGLNEEPFGSESYECIDLVLNPPTPLMLAYPEDGAKLKLTRPTLTWIPPMPIALSSNLTYTFTLCEMRKGQSKMDALKRNRPLIFRNSIPTTTLTYPMDMEELEKGKHYSWQVEAWVGRTKVGTSDVWEFEIEQEEEEEEDIIFSYVLINQNKDLHFFEGELNFLYLEKHFDGPIIFEIKNSDGEVIKLDSNTLEAVYGENKFTIELNKYAEIKDGYYELTLFDKSKKKHRLRFNYTFSAIK